MIASRLASKRFWRYAAVSLVAVGLAQAGLAVGYGLLRWPVVGAVMFSLIISVVPSYFLNRMLVWPDQCRPRPELAEAGSFFGVAVIGALITVLFVAASIHLAGGPATDHVTLSVVANLSSIFATGVVWLARYVILDRWLFRPTMATMAPASLNARSEGYP